MALETQDAGTARRRWWWRPRLLGVLIVGLGCLWWVWDSQPGVMLPNGARLVIERVTYGRQHDQKPPPLAKLANRLWNRPLNSYSCASPDSDSIVLWLQCRSRWLHRPRDFGDVQYAVLIDRDGWPHAFTPISWNERTWDGAHPELPQPFDSNKLRRGSDVAGVATLPPVRTRGTKLTIGFVDRSGRLVGTVDVEYPGPSAPESTWTSEALPAVRQDGDLSVALVGIDFRRPVPSPDVLAPIGPASPCIVVQPRFDIRWKGRPCVDCCFECDTRTTGTLRDPLYSYGEPAEACMLSPFEPAWELTQSFYPSPFVEFAAAAVWSAGEVAIPPLGELSAVERRGLIHDGEYGVEYVGGVGRHELTIEIGQRINLHKLDSNDGRYRVVGRRMGQTSTDGTYDIETEVPFLVVSSPTFVISEDDTSRTTPSFHTLIQHASGTRIALEAEMLSWVQWTHNMKGGVDCPREYWIAFLPTELRDVRSVHPTLAEYRFREFKFLIRPPSLDVYERLKLLPETVSARRTARD